MHIINLDADARAKLEGLEVQTLFFDENGRFLGFFLPPDVYKKLVYRNIEIPFTEEELDRRRKEGGGRPLSELWPRLENGQLVEKQS